MLYQAAERYLLPRVQHRDPLAMAMYALAVRPLIDLLQSNGAAVRQVWFADDATGVASCSQLRAWWDNFLEHGKVFGYYPNASKTHLVKAQFFEKAKHLFAGTNMNISTQRKHHLGAAIGNIDFIEQYVKQKVKMWTQGLHQLAEIATSQPHAAYASFTHGLSSGWTGPTYKEQFPLSTIYSNYLKKQSTNRSFLHSWADHPAQS